MSTPAPAPVEPTMPVGPWLLVVGMHRSGTSAVTGALGQLGLAVPVELDRFEPSEDNPDHWESQALGLRDDALLERLGGTWDRPPAPDLGWESDPDLAVEELGDPAVPAAKAFPDARPVVWKDPRTCLLLPYWLAHLPKPVAAVFIWRSPLSVARSLRARDGLHLADGVALWERYNRSGLAGLVGVDTFVTRYESIVEDPLGKLGDIAAWLGELPQFADHAPRWDLARAAAAVSPQLLRQQPSGDSELLLDEQRRLVEHLGSLDGGHRPLASSPPGAESPWTTALLADRQELAPLSIERDELRQTVAAQEVAAIEASGEMQLVRGELQVVRGELQAARGEIERQSADLESTRRDLAAMTELYEQMQASTSWRVTRPLRQVVAFKDRKGMPPNR